ncbi:MAG: metal ABC transporter permease [Planctomycetes bacterium]|nr:metal ABC transporter permease [Planctomycetota bacterium]
MIDIFMNPAMLDILLVAILAAVTCSIVGVHLTLRNRAMLGDAIAHGVVPGLILGFIFTGSREVAPMFIGAVIAALILSLIADWLKERAEMDGGAALGVVFTTLFSGGIILIELYTREIDLDASCVLHGLIEFTHFQRMELFGWSLPRSIVTISIALLLNLGALLLFWKEWKVCAFDPSLARSTGLPVQLLERGLLVLVAITAVSCFEAVGSILVVAMIAVPPTIAGILCDRFGSMIAVSALTGLISAVAGTLSAVYVVDSNVPGMIALTSGLLLGIAVLLAPQRGILPVAFRLYMWRVRVAREDLLADSLQLSESDERLTTPNLISTTGFAWIQLVIVGFIRDGKPRGKGKRIAKTLLRKRSLWQRFASERLGLPPDHLEGPAHRIEHHLDESLMVMLEEEERTGKSNPETGS